MFQMPNERLIRTTGAMVLLGLLFLTPGRAEAADGWLDWLDGWSGPGPFVGAGVSLEVLCWREDDNAPRIPEDPDQNADNADPNDTKPTFCFEQRLKKPAKHTLSARAGWYFWKTREQRFSDEPKDTGTVKIVRLEWQYALRVHRLVEIGAGIGLMNIYGDGFDSIQRLIISPLTASIAFSEEMSPVQVRLRLSGVYMPTGFVGEDFGNQVTHYETKSEFVPSIGLEFRF